MKNIHIARFVICALIWVCSGSTVQSFAKGGGDSQVERAFKTKANNVQVAGEGVVTHILADDFDGSRHQRFIVRLASEQTVLIAHNIDIASRVTGLKKGDWIRFYGEYVWNEKGGMVHWTHHDPEGRHTAGWLKHKGRNYQ